MCEEIISYMDFEKKFMYQFKKHNIPVNESEALRFYKLTNILLSENKKYNLTAIKDLDEIIVKHYIDSIAPLAYFTIPENAKIIDVGTGAGFPALPLSIMRGDLNITFLDSSAKKINFIEKATEKIELNKSKYIFCRERAEILGRNIKMRQTYDFALSRAVAKLNVLCELASPFINTGGFFIAYKSQNATEEIAEAENSLKILNLKIDEIAEFDLNCEKRFLIKIKKIKKTPPQYPRSFSNIIKSSIIKT